MKKYLYIIIGVGILTLAVSIFMWSWSDGDFFRLFISFTSRVRVAGLLASLFSGYVYLYYGIKHEKINRVADTSLIILFFTAIIYVVAMQFGCNRIGSPCLQSELLIQHIGNYALLSGLIVGVLMLVLSLFYKKRDI